MTITSQLRGKQCLLEWGETLFPVNPTGAYSLVGGHTIWAAHECELWYTNVKRSAKQKISWANTYKCHCHSDHAWSGLFHTPKYPFHGAHLATCTSKRFSPKQDKLDELVQAIEWLVFKVQDRKIIQPFASTLDLKSSVAEVLKFGNRRCKMRGYWYKDDGFLRSSHSHGSLVRSSELKILALRPSIWAACVHARCITFLCSWLSWSMNYANWQTDQLGASTEQ